MSLQAFLYFPQNDLGLLEAEKNFQQIISIITEIKKQQAKIYYDEDNIKTFFSKIQVFNNVYWQKQENILRIKLGTTTESIQNSSQKNANEIYIIWNLEKFNITYAPNLLAEITERILKFPTEKYIFINLFGEIEKDRQNLFVFKDALQNIDLPSKFVKISVVEDISELEIWLKTNHIQKFSLLDKQRFRRTKEVNQGKPMFEEIKTGYFWYLDNFHKNEYEVFNAQRKHIGVADLEGNLDETKKIEGRSIE